MTTTAPGVDRWRLVTRRYADVLILATDPTKLGMINSRTKKLQTGHRHLATQALWVIAE